jgi:hypothetical protein
LVGFFVSWLVVNVGLVKKVLQRTSGVKSITMQSGFTPRDLQLGSLVETNGGREAGRGNKMEAVTVGVRLKIVWWEASRLDSWLRCRRRLKGEVAGRGEARLTTDARFHNSAAWIDARKVYEADRREQYGRGGGMLQEQKHQNGCCCE